MKFDFSYKEMIREVNKLDKECGLNLKNPEGLRNDPDTVYEITLSRIQMYLAKLMAAVNGIDTDEYFASFDEMGMIGGPLGIKDPVFIEYSNLEWIQNGKYDMNSLIFKCRFLSQYLYYSIGYLDEQTCCKFYTRDINVDPYSHRYFYLKEIGTHMKRLCLSMLGGSSYSNILLVNLFDSNYCIGKVSPKKAQKIRSVNVQIKDAVLEIRDNMGIRSFMSDYPDDMGIYSIIRLAYLISVKNRDFSSLPSFDDLQGATVEHDLVRVIRKLGECIIDAHKYKKRPVMYRAFNDASPLIMTNYSNVNNDTELAVGIRALAYAGFIVNDRKVNKFITKMINYGKERLEEYM